jgi:hypothetical protein
MALTPAAFNVVPCSPSYSKEAISTEPWVSEAGGFVVPYDDEAYERVGGGWTTALPLRGKFATYEPGGHVWELDGNNWTGTRFRETVAFIRSQNFIDDR